MSAKLWRRADSRFYPIFPGPQAVLKPAAALPQRVVFVPVAPFWNSLHVSIYPGACRVRPGKVLLEVTRVMSQVLDLLLLHLTVFASSYKVYFPSEGRGGVGPAEGEKERNPHPVPLGEFKVVTCSNPSSPFIHSFIQQTLIADLPCGRNYVRGYKYE